LNGNLDARGVQQRYVLGMAGLLAGLIATALGLSGHLPGHWMKLIFIPFALAALGFFQAREKT